jgi:uncharacterized protein (UPF0332 family)/predicted nucleotidyltransferase
MSVLLIEPTIDERATARLEDTSLSPAERRGLLAYLDALEERWGHLLAEVVLYGSAARGEERHESDVDILLVLNREPTQAQIDQIQHLASAIDLDFGIALSPLLMSPATYRWHREGAPLWHNIRREGLWLRGAPSPTIYELPGGKPLEQKRKEMIALYFEHCDENIEMAGQALESRLPRSAIGNCYYAIFYAASAVLLSQGIERSKHSGIRSAFSQYFVKKSIFPKAFGDLFETLQKERESADYNMTYLPGEEVAEQRFEQAQNFVQTIRDYLKERGFLDG